MYNKKYRLENIEEFNGHNYIYDDMLGKVCYLVYLNIGERGWFLWEDDDLFSAPHRIHTSTVKDVKYAEDKVIVATNNTKFTFALIVNREV